MTELEQICENALYDVIRVLEDGKSVVRDIPTGRLYFKKTLDVYNLQVFAYLRDHRSRHVPAVQAFWKEGGSLVVIEELVQGRTLDEILDSAPEDLDFSGRIDVLAQVCDGLSFLHGAEPPIIHRDIKASNIMVTDDGVVKIIDYDAAKIYIAGQKKDTVMLGTQGLAAPEQYGFAQSDVRTDLYAFGKLIERMLPDNDDAKRIAAKATQMDPEKRYASAAQMKTQILRIREAPSFLDQKLEKIPGFDPMDRKQRVRARIALAAGALAAVLIVAALGWRFFVYPAKVTEQIGAEIEAIAALGTSDGLIPDAVREFAQAHAYKKMNAAQKKAVRDGMEHAIELCYLGEKRADAQEVVSVLAENYGDEALWEALHVYGKAGCDLARYDFEAGLSALYTCVAKNAIEASEHWDAGVLKTRKAAESNMDAFRESAEVSCLSVIAGAYRALDAYSPGADGEIDKAYQEILAVAAAKRDAKEGEAAAGIYQALLKTGLGDEEELAELLRATRYEIAEAAFSDGAYSEAAAGFEELGDYKDAPDKRKESLYLQGRAALDAVEYETAVTAFDKITGYKDAGELCLLAKYRYCDKTLEEPTETTYEFFEALIDAEYEDAESLREEIYKWRVDFQTGMSYSFGPMQSAYLKVTLRGGPPDGETTITFRIDDPTRGEHDVWSDGKKYSRGDKVEVSYSEEDSSYSLFDRTYKVSVYADNEELIGVWVGQFSTEPKDSGR